MKKDIEKYKIYSNEVEAEITIAETDTEYIPLYELKKRKISLGIQVVLDEVKEELIKVVPLSTKEFIDPKVFEGVKTKFREKAIDLLENYFPNLAEKEKRFLACGLVNDMLGLGDIELILSDPNLEEIVVNCHREPIWVYHKRHNWLKTNIYLDNEEEIYNYSSAIGRRVGMQISNLHPLMDAHLTTGDRVNATIFPISTKGNTITIRKFSRSPWTIIHFLEAKTFSKDVAAFLWLAIQYELNIMVSGGTASGKTSMLGVILPFIPPNQRIISIEDTREIQLPDFLHWVPLSSRGSNPEGKGEITMLDLMVNALRMRPDRLIIGEIRRAKEAEVMFEAIRTGHSAYATFHGDRADQVFKRLTNSPINLAESMLSALHLIVVQYRHRRKGIRRTTEVAEIISTEDKCRVNIIYRWNAQTDQIEKINEVYRIYDEISMYSGMTKKEIETDIANKVVILDWMMKHKIKTVNSVGKILAEYYQDEKKIIKAAVGNISPKEILGEKLYGEIIKSD
ncbi:MAG: CpaF family protein [Candidatus Aenigmarchaeota archaeon]|nr:CpaF family protein [Candidatus Aenigmarchaeota archaeon]